MALSPYNRDTELVRHRKYERKDEIAVAHRNQVVSTLTKDERHVKQGLAVQGSGRTISTRFIVLKKESEMYVLSILRVSKEKKYSMHSRVPLRSHSALFGDGKKFGSKGESFYWIELKTAIYIRKGKLEHKSYYLGFQSPEERDEWKSALSLQFKKDVPVSSPKISSNPIPLDEIEIDDEYRISDSDGEEVIEVASEEHPFFNPFDFVDPNDPLILAHSNSSRDSPAMVEMSTPQQAPQNSLFSSQKSTKSNLSTAFSCPVVPSDYNHASSASSFQPIQSPASPPPSPYTPSSNTVVNINSPYESKRIDSLPQSAFMVSESSSVRTPPPSTSSTSRTPPPSTSSSSSISSSSQKKSAPPVPSSANPRRSTGNYLNAIALYRFTATDKDEMDVEAGDRILITHFASDQEWWQGRNQRTKQVGLFPRNYVQLS